MIPYKIPYSVSQAVFSQQGFTLEMQFISMRKIYAIVPFVLIYLYVLILVDPRLIYHAQEPPFLFDTNFFLDFARYPGGLAWYAGAFLTQFHVFPWAGALITTLGVFLVYWLARIFLSVTGMKKGGDLIAMAPALALFAAMGDYRFPLAYMLDVIIALVSANLYLCLRTGSRFVRTAFCVLLAVAAYYCTGTGVLLFIVISCVYEAFIKKDIAVGAAIFGIGAVLPFVAARFLFEMSPAAAYLDFLGVKTFLLAAAQYPRTPALVYAAHMVFPCVIVLARVIPSWCAGCNKRLFGIWSTVLIVCILAVVAFLSFDTKAKRNFQIDYYARNDMWSGIVQAVTPARLTDYTILSQTHLFRALYHENRLLSELFTYPGGLPGRSFMAVTGQMAPLFPMQMSDCCFEAGGLNLAEFWAHEALGMQGKKPWILWQLALINILKGRKQSAEKFIALLEKTPFRGTEARICRRFLENDSLFSSDGNLLRIKSYAPRTEYLCRDYYSELVNLFDGNSKNRIAFEYIIAENLLNNFISPVIGNLGFFAMLGYCELPRHVQEAAVFHRSLSGDTMTAAGGFRLAGDLFGNFNRFTQIMSQFGNDRATALNASAAGFGTTYWYYLMSTNRPVLIERKE
jgi:hypothetical protein